MHARRTACRHTALHMCRHRLHTCSARCTRAPGVHASKRLCTRAQRIACTHVGLRANIPEVHACKSHCVHARASARMHRKVHARTRLCMHVRGFACIQ